MSKSISTHDLENLHQEVPGDYYNKSIEKNFLQRFWHIRRFREAERLLKIKRVRNILDIGCHGGIFTNHIAKNFPNSKIYGIDISKEAISFAKKTYPNIKFKISRAENLSFKKKVFDLVTCFEVLEHIENPQIVINEISRVIKRNGYLLVMVPSENLIFRFIWFFWSKLGPGRVWKHTHIQKFRNKKLENLLISNGFSIEIRKFILFGMLLLILAKRS